MKGVKRYKLAVAKEINHGDAMYSIVTIINNTMLHI